MSQASPTIGANKSGLVYRQEDNDGKTALLNHHKGASAPSYAEAGAIWLDDSSTPWALKIYDGADWITLGGVNATANTFQPYAGTAALKYLNYATDTGSANAYAVAPSPATTAYAAGQVVMLKPANASTGAATINISALGTKPIKLPDGSDTNGYSLQTSGIYCLVYNGTNFTVINPSPAPLARNDLPAGSVLQTVYASYSSNSDLSTTIPNDDTLPQNTEGTEVLTASITPTSATSMIEVQFAGFGSGAASANIVIALFKDSGANALHATASTPGGAALPTALALSYAESAGSTSAHTYRIRIGMNSGTCRLNGTTSARLYGGAAASTLIIREIKA